MTHVEVCGARRAAPGPTNLSKKGVWSLQAETFFAWMLRLRRSKVLGAVSYKTLLPNDTHARSRPTPEKNEGISGAARPKFPQKRRGGGASRLRIAFGNRVLQVETFWIRLDPRAKPPHPKEKRCRKVFFRGLWSEARCASLHKPLLFSGGVGRQKRLCLKITRCN